MHKPTELKDIFIGLGVAMGYMGYEKDQPAEKNHLNIWAHCPDGTKWWKEAVKKALPSAVFSEGNSATALIILNSPLRNPEGLLRDLGNSIENAWDNIFQDAMRQEEYRDDDYPDYDPYEDEDDVQDVPTQVWFTEGPLGHNGWE